MITKLGTIDPDIVETTPLVFRNRLYRFEYIRARYWNNPTKDSYFRFVDAETNETTPALAKGFHLGSAMVYRNRIIVFAVKAWGGNTLYQMESSDLANWTEPQAILSDPAWAIYNTSCCPGSNGFILAVELGKPEELVGEPFAVVFAESDDLISWRYLPEIPVFTPEHYTACPTIRYVDGYYYLFVLEGSYETQFSEHLYRSADLKNWLPSPLNPVLVHSDADRIILSRHLTPHQRQAVAEAKNINASDIDLCEFNGKTIIYYSWGDQKGHEFLAAAESPKPLAVFLKSFFE